MIASALRFGRSGARVLKDRAVRGFSIARHGGLSQALLFVREEVMRNTVILMTKNRIVEESQARASCNVCGWVGRRFMAHVGAGYVVMNAMCPRCGSFPRHRGFAWLIDRLGIRENLRESNAGPGRRLMFAPEPSMFALLGRDVERLEGVDVSRINDLVDHIEDIQALSFADGSVDLISCFHVIEHVPDDRRALRELRRVLSEDGMAIVNVPITFGRWESVEFGRPDPLLNFHYFDYGEEFSTRLVDAGLSGVGYRLSRVIAGKEFHRLGLQDELIYLVSPGPIPGRIVDDAGQSLTEGLVP